MARQRWLVGLIREAERLQRIPFPLVGALRTYSARDARGDLGAALQSALMVFPRAICCAFLAGVPVRCGLLSAAVASVVGAFFASSRYLILTPTRISAILLLSLLLTRHAGVDPAHVAGALALLTGVLLVAAAYLDLGRAARFIPRSVFVGFISGAAVLVVFSQIHCVLGFDIPQPENFYDACDATLRRLGTLHAPSAALGCSVAALWLLLAHRWPAAPATAISLMAASIAGALLNGHGAGIRMIGGVDLGAWLPQTPHFQMGKFGDLASSAVAIVLLGIAESSFTARRLAAEVGEHASVNREMFRIGLANAAASIFQGMPAFASPYCSRVNMIRGARTPLSALFAGIFVAAGALLFGWTLAWTPVPAVAAVAICLGVRLISPSDIRIAACATMADATVYLITLFAALTTPLDIALYFGIGASLLMVLRRLPEPRLAEYVIDGAGGVAPAGSGNRAPSGIVILHAEGEMAFGPGDALFEQVCRLCQEDKIRVVILQMRAARALDASGLTALRELLAILRKTGRHLVVAGSSRDVRTVLRNSGLIDDIGENNVLVSGRDNPLLVTRHALTRAQELIDSGPAPPPD